MKKITNIFSFTFILFLVSCAENDVTETSENNETNNGPFYAQFLACQAGPDYSSDNLAKMIADFNQLNLSDDLMWVGGYAPVEGQNQYSNGWWEMNWSSKEAADAAWAEWMADEEAQAWDNGSNNVLECDNSTLSGWNFYTPGNTTMEDWTSFATATFECTYNEGKGSEDLKANVEEYNNWLDSNGSEDPYMYGVYFAEDNSDEGFIWLNWHDSFDSMETGNDNWAKTGQAVQAGFDDTATCTTPDLYNSAEFYSPDQS
jgi:hypothetical protein